MTVASIATEAVELLADLIRIETVNPPGRETAAAERLRAYLEPAGVPCRLLARDPDRANLVARIAGRDPAAPRLLLLSHTDVVPADARDWTVGPFSGEVRDDHVWGRGALDMKGQVAASAVAMASLAREGFRPRGDLVLVASADEEVGAGYGLSWLCEAHPQEVRAEWAVNEGGGDRFTVGDGHLWLCSVAEKRTSAVRLVVNGRAGHASTPGLAENALVRAAELIGRLDALAPPPRTTPETEALLGAIEGHRALPPGLDGMVQAMLAPTVVPTVISASEATNVIPGSCAVICDCRLLPGQDRAEVEALIRTALGPEGYEIEWLESVGGTRSPLGTPLWSAIEAFVAAEDPGATLAPMLMPGFTDSHWLREAFGTVAYGFFPLRMDPAISWALVHSADERIAIADLELGTRFLRHVARTLLG
jgi:acetylornithine deacetylase/succinyl-diaminopimelate desuccinylase-like protein